VTLPIDGASPMLLNAPQDPAEQQVQGREAARQFEELLMQQLWQVMRRTAGEGAFGSSIGSGTYTHFIDQAVAEQLSRAGGIGLAASLEQSLGVTSSSASGAARAASTPTVRQAPLELGPSTGTRVSGATGRLQRAATEMLTTESAPRWGRDGRLTRTELSSDFSTPLPGGEVAAFNVRDAAGFQGRYKCNLFAFELVRRAGFQTPLMARTHGWGYPHPDRVTEDASDGRLRRDWGRVVTGESAEALDASIQGGHRAFLLSGSGTDGHAGHMAVVERVHRVDYDDEGRVERVVFDGWEARQGGASRLTERTWNVYGNPGGNDPRNGLQGIEIVELLAPRAGRPEMPLSRRVGPSNHDAPPPDAENERPVSTVRSSFVATRPMAGVEAD